MTNIVVTIRDGVATAELTGILTNGMVGVPVSFDLGPEWEDLTVVAVIRGNDLTFDRPLLGIRQTTVPFEVLERVGEHIYIGAEGCSASGDLVIQSNMAKVEEPVRQGADPSGDLAMDPTKPFWAEVMDELARLQKLGGVSDAEKALLLSLFKNAAYTTDMSAAVSQLEALWSGSGDAPNIPDEPVGTVFTVANNLTGVTNSNQQTEVTEGFYSASLSWEDGYELNNIVITMGGVDITDQVYGEGGILITEVTGDIVITAEAGIPVLYRLANTPVTCNADLYESTGLTSGASDATLVTKPWTLCAKFVRPANDCNILAATNDETINGFTIRSNASYVGHFPRVGWCKGVVSCDVPNGTVSKIVVTHEANGNWGVKVYSEVGGGVAQTVGATYNNMTHSYYAGELYVGGATAANFIGTIYDFTIYGAVLSEDEIKAYLGVA